MLRLSVVPSAGRALLSALQPALLVGLAAAQAPIAPTGFGVRTVFVEASHGARVRGVAIDPAHGCFVAIGDTLFHRPDPLQNIPLHTLPNRDDIGAVVRDARGHVLFTALAAGTIHDHDPGTGITTTLSGVANTFDIAPLGNGDLLLSANPTWPAPGATTGVWLAGPARTPRRLLTLQGPSGPLLLDRAGNLIVAEIGAQVPPPPGAVRLLRFPAPAVAAAIAGATLTTSSADRVGTGWDGAFDLADDDRGRLYVTDPASAIVHCAAVDQLVPTQGWVDVGAGRAALQLQFAPCVGSAFLPWQPAEHASALLVAATDYAGRFEVLRVESARPALTVWPGPTFGAGTAVFAIEGAPPGALCFFGGTFAPPVPERIVHHAGPVPLWLALPDHGAIAVRAALSDAQGQTSLPLRHPGGFAAAFHLQAVALSPTGDDHGTSPLLSTALLR